MYVNSMPIEDALKVIFSKISTIDLHNCAEKLFDEDLLGNTFNLSARDLLYLFVEIEKAFKIRIPQEAVVQEKFRTFNEICQVIKAQADAKSKTA